MTQSKRVRAIVAASVAVVLLPVAATTAQGTPQSTNPPAVASRAVTPAVAPASVVPVPVKPRVTTLTISDLVSHAVSSAPRGVALATGVLTVPVADLVGVSWLGPGERGTRLLVWVREGGRWGAVTELGIDQAVRRGRVSAEPLVTHGADRVRLQILTPSGKAPRDVRLVAITSPASRADSSMSPGITRSSLRPAVITRAQWGADETRRTGAPVYSSTLRVGFLHHTTGWSTYTQAQAAQFIRALYDWYTTPVGDGGPGYSDIAYNVLVDRFGRVFEGRAGGFDRPVKADAVVGFDDQTFSVAAMGDFEANPLPAASSDAMVSSIAAVMAWKLAAYHRSPLATDRLTSTAGGGSSRYLAGQVATLPVISPHLLVAMTECPGHSLMAQLSAIRTRAAALVYQILPKPTPSFGRLAVPAAAVAYLAPAGATLQASTNRPMRWTATIGSPCSTQVVRVLSGAQTSPGRLTIGWNLRDSLGVPVTPGSFSVRITGSAADGGQVAAPVLGSVRVVPAGGSSAGPCTSVVRASGPDTSATSVAIGRWSEPAAAAAILVGDAPTDAGFAQVAAPLAHARHLPLLAVHRTSVPPVVLADLVARGVHSVIVVGTVDSVTPSVVAQLVKSHIGVTRLAGADLPSVAAAVAQALGAPGDRGAIYVSTGAPAYAAAIAAAAAARTGRPLLILGQRSVPTVTATVVHDLGITGGSVIAPGLSVPFATVQSLGATRTWFTDPVALSLALIPSTGAGDRVLLSPSISVENASLAASAGRPIVPAGGTGIPAAFARWLASHFEVQQVGVAVPPVTLPDASLAALARSMAARIAPMGVSVTPALTRIVTPTPVPASFTVTGSGWGHGIGLSQAGAFGQAREGRTAQQIVTHYYTGTTVAPVVDTMELAVALLDRVAAVNLRTEPMSPTSADATGAIRLVLAGGATIVGDSQDQFGFRYRNGRVVVIRTRAGVSAVVGTASRVHVTWAGTREAGALGTSPTLVNLLGPGDAFRDAQHRYRFGSIDVRPIGASSYASAGMMVLNNVRLHDEYLDGIAEVEASWPLAALQAQILASRSYAYAQWKAGLRSSCWCHSDDGGGPYYDQTFLGWVKVDEGSYSPAWRAAVASTDTSATTGLAILYHQTVITAYYTDSTGGFTQNNEDVWGDAPLPWARSVDDHWSLDPRNSPSFAHWRPRVRSQQAVAAAFGLPDVVSVRVTSRRASTSVRTITATSSTGVTATISGARFRARLSLPSQWVWTVVPTSTTV